MYKIFIYTLLCLLLFACSSNNKHDEPLKMEDIISQSKRYKEGQAKTDKKETTKLYLDTIPSRYKQLADSIGIAYQAVFPIFAEDFTDRFEYLQKQKFYWISKKDSMSFKHWQFKDSLKTLNAFYNWMDHFGPTRKSIPLYSAVRLQKTPLTILVSEKDLYALESNKNINVEQWRKWLNPNPKQKWKFILQQNKTGKAMWFKVENDSLKPFVKLNKKANEITE